MPNWMTNYLTVKKDVAEKFILNDKKEVDFEILAPMSEEIRNSNDGRWYDWSINNWGCKWNASESYIEEMGDDEVRLSFDTPWCTPDAWLQKLAEMKIDFHLAWYEEQGYRGIMICKNGCITEFDLPDVDWIECDDGEYISSDSLENFDWRDIVREGQFEELIG